MAPAGAVTRATMEDLPNEIILHIIKLSLPSPTRNPQPRYDRLRAFSLVDQRWSRLARVEMFEHIKVTDENDGHWDMVDALDHTGKWKSVRRLTASESEMSLDRSLFMLEKCKLGLSGVWLSNLCLSWWSRSSDRALRVLAELPNLTRLHLDDLITFSSFDGGMAPSPQPPLSTCFPKLQLLSLFFNREEPEGDADFCLLQPSTFPSLTSLNVHFGRLVWSDSFRAPLHDLGPQLESLMLYSDDDSLAHGCVEEPRTAGRLRALNLGTCYDDLQMALEVLPPGLEILRLSTYFDEHLIHELGAVGPESFTHGALSTLRRMVLSNSDSAVQKWCKKHKIRCMQYLRGESTAELEGWRPTIDA